MAVVVDVAAVAMVVTVSASTALALQQSIDDLIWGGSIQPHNASPLAFAIKLFRPCTSTTRLFSPLACGHEVELYERACDRLPWYALDHGFSGQPAHYKPAVGP